MSEQLIQAIDPGPTQSALVTFRGWEIVNKEILENLQLRDYLAALNHPGVLLAIEMVQSFGMPVGASVFETVFWIGRFVEAWSGKHRLIYRKDIKLHLCGSSRAKDGNVRQALLDLYKPAGGGKTPQIGTKAKPGPLYGMKSHLWSALAVAVTAHVTVEKSADD